MSDHIEQRLYAMEHAEDWVTEAQRQNHQLHPALAEAITQCVRAHGLSQAGVFNLIDTIDAIERAEGRLPPKPAADMSFLTE